jgi:hypothetical protein
MQLFSAPTDVPHRCDVAERTAADGGEGPTRRQIVEARAVRQPPSHERGERRSIATRSR